MTPIPAELGPEAWLERHRGDWRSLVRRLFEIARDEDLGSPARDITTQACGLGGTSVAYATMRAPGSVSGLGFVPLLAEVYAFSGTIRPLMSDAEIAGAGDVLLMIEGPTDEVLSLERPLLNLIGRLSGIATLTRSFVERVRGTNATMVDTRKTTPGHRMTEKYAVVCGGGGSHRLGLHDAVLIKDNHIAGIDDLTSWINQASARARAVHPAPSFIEVEVDNLDQLAQVLDCEDGAVDFVLLDNMPPERLREAVAARNQKRPSVRLEASGGVTLETVAEIASTGVDRISCGALTHGATSLDVGLDFQA